ncbi:hypothetical protein BCR33DRAFT_39684 [Rhizoclosmatium globosum]|uniref:Uncharacterized protein n=1 Tax=Rhizoclosmatium globosum TaxID=329046 RepID=A0A1Y2CNK7_9FUNG|nr:hypothetical protein BCR33DRAFT_39684 [Rhizoclosmatium globosum]|eukprot:ORY48601.1 hypothetical protein BCR33DRAFT_39684 [Rhizoclosmatium globosum]
MTTPSQSYYPKHNMQNHDGYIGASGSEADASTTTPAEQCRVGLSIADLISDDENEQLDHKSNGRVLEEVERDLSSHDEHIDMDSHSGSTVDRSSELLPTSLGESVKHHIPDAGSSRDESHPHETFFGFIKEPMDALLIVEACIRGILVSVDKVPSESSEVFHIRSGSIVVFQESSKRWRDGRKWSPSRVHGPFLLYREVEPTKRAPEPRKSKPTHILDTRIPGLEPTYSFKTLKQNTRLVPDGLTKRTITLKGSDGIRHRVISYYARDDVINMYAPPIDASSNERLKFRTPSETPQLNSLLNDSAIDLKALLAESIDMEKYASEMAIAKKQRKEETIKAVARHAFGYEDDDGEGDIRGSNVSPAKRTKRPTSTVSPSRRRPSEELNHRLLLRHIIPSNFTINCLRYIQ